MNRWSIPAWLEKEVRERDKACVYCGIDMLETPPLQGPRKAVATWEHIINDARLICRENIARCCAACNSSKGSRVLSVWIESEYCQKHGITNDSVSEVVKAALKNAALSTSLSTTPP